MEATVVKSRGRGRGRGLGAGWLGKFKPKELSLSKPELSSNKSNYEDADDINLYFSTENFNTNIKRQTSVEEMVSQIAFDISKEVKRQNSREKNTDNIVFDEKPETQISGTQNEIENNISKLHNKTFQKPVNGIVDEEKPQATNTLTTKNIANDLKPKYDPVLLNALGAKEFTPFKPNIAAKFPMSDYIVPEKSNRDIVMHVLNDISTSLIDDPGYIEDYLPNIALHLENFVHEEDLLKEIVDFFIDKMLSEENFRYIGSRISHHIDQNVKFESMKYRPIFYGRCQSEFKNVKTLFKDLSSENFQYIENVALMFGELLCNTKVKDQVNAVFRKVIFDFIDFFLDTKSEYCLKSMVKLLKLVGPELDRERPKDVETMFNKVRDFYLDQDRSSFLTSPTRDLIWRVYKLHSRDWDRNDAVPPSPTFTTTPRKFSSSSLPSATSDRRLSNDRSSPVDWDEYDYGDDEIYDQYDDVADEEYDAYDEFLRLTGQI